MSLVIRGFGPVAKNCKHFCVANIKLSTMWVARNHVYTPVQCDCWGAVMHPSEEAHREKNQTWFVYCPMSFRLLHGARIPYATIELAYWCV